MLEYALHAPEAAARNYGRLGAGDGGKVHLRSRDDSGPFGTHRGRRKSDNERDSGKGAGERLTEMARAHGVLSIVLTRIDPTAAHVIAWGWMI
jgi:hypothetical protein